MGEKKQSGELEKLKFSILKIQRKSLNLTQQQVADIASIDIRLYQLFESGERCLSRASFRIGVAVAYTLELDVHMLVYTPSVEEYLKNKQQFKPIRR